MVESNTNVQPEPSTLEIKPNNGVDPYLVVALTRENITKEIAFSAQVTGNHPEVPNKLAIDSSIKARDIVLAVNHCMEEAISVNATVVWELLKHIPHTYEDLGNILIACTLGVQKVAQKNDDVYLTKHPEMGEYRWLMKWVKPMFDTAVNKSLDPH